MYHKASDEFYKLLSLICFNLWKTLRFFFKNSNILEVHNFFPKQKNIAVHSSILVNAARSSLKFTKKSIFAVLPINYSEYTDKIAVPDVLVIAPSLEVITELVSHEFKTLQDVLITQQSFLLFSGAVWSLSAQGSPSKSLMRQIWRISRWSNHVRVGTCW